MPEYNSYLPVIRRFYPTLDTLLNEGDLPDNIDYLKEKVADLLSHIHFKDYIYNSSPKRDSVSSSLKIVIQNKLGLTIPGTGINLLLNPDVSGDQISAIPITFEYHWKVLALINDLEGNLANLSVHNLFSCSLELLNLTEEDVIQGFIDTFAKPNNSETSRLQQFINDLNQIENVQLPDENQLSGLSELISILKYQCNTDASITVFEYYILDDNRDTVLFKIWSLLGNIIPRDINSFIKDYLFPKYKVSALLTLGIDFPRKILQPVCDENGVNPFNGSTGNLPFEIIPPDNPNSNDDPDQPRALFNFGLINLHSDSEIGIGSESELVLSTVTPVQIGNSGLILTLNNAKLDISRTKNIPEADADGRPSDFIGVYITEGAIGFPADWGHNSDPGNQSSAELFVNNLLVGTGGISGTIGMRSTTPAIASDPNADQGLIELKFGQNFKASLTDFSLTFQQNAIIESNIHGTLQIPGFKNEDGSQAILDIDIHIGQEGEFSIVATSAEELKKIKIPDVFSFEIKSAFIGREQGDDGRFYLGISGELEFTAPGALGNFLPDKLDIKKMLIYDDGTFEFEGGKLVLPRAYELRFGPATLSITGIHMGAHEQDGRKYKYFGFDGGVSTNPGGVDAQGKGLKFYYTTEGTPFKWFIRLESLTVDIILPSGTDPSEAAVILHGFLSIAEPKILPGTPPEMVEILKNSQEYAGGVSLRMPKFRGLEGSAAMRMNPKVPSFIIDLGIEMKQPILLGATGLGIYGFRALLGKKYVAEKTAAGVPADGEWWQYYKAKIDPDYKEGIQVSKFATRDGFSLGAGVSLATASDSGKVFSSKLFFMLSLPDVFLFQGQAQFLKERIGLDANPDPPFFAIIAITKNSIEAGFGVNYKLRDNGKLVTVDGIVEMGFFWGNSGAWYVNIGRETPEDRRIQARLFDILNMYFYLMLSSGGMRLGAGVKFELAKKFGPISAELKAYIDTFGKISRRPKQIGGAIKMGGKVSIKVCGFGFGISGGATLAAEASQPHIITGEFEVCVTVLKKERCARFEFTWNFNDQLSLTHNPILVGTSGDDSDSIDANDGKRVAGMTHMVTQERFPVAYTSIDYSQTIGDIPAPDSWITDTADDFRVPIDSFLDIDFKKGMNVSSAGTNNLGKLGGISSPAKYVEFVPPLRGKSDRVRHEYYLRDISIAYWDEISESWKPYDFYNALLPFYLSGPLSSSDTETQDAIEEAIQNMKWGYWQQQSPGLNNKLRILATTPLSYMANTADAYTLEDLGINSNTLFCPGDAIPQTCIVFEPQDVTTIFPSGTLRNYENVLFRTVNQDGVVIAETFDGYDQGLVVASGDTLEIYFSEPMYSTKIEVNTTSSQVTIEYYRRKFDGYDDSNLPVYTYQLKHTEVKTTGFDEEELYSTADDGIDFIKIIPGTCSGGNTIVSEPVPNASTILNDIETFLSTLIGKHHLDAASVSLYPTYSEDYESFFGSSIYAYQPEHEDEVLLTQQYISPVSLAFTITDNLGYSCTYTLEPTELPDGFTFGAITDIKGISPYTADDALGYNNNLLVDFDVLINGNLLTARFILTTCHSISVGYNSCNAILYKLCYLSMENYLLNSSIPLPGDQEAANDALFDSINMNLQPVWRPNTIFAVTLKTSDMLYREGSSNAETGFHNQAVFGFRTAGPIGHFHQYPVDGENEPVKRQDYEALDNKGKADEFRLTSLKSYIDYTKSYPNADGDLSNAKPLFYENASLNLFYTYNHVYHFFNNWLDYENSGAHNIAHASLGIRVLNPAPSTTPETTVSEGFVINRVSHASTPGTPPSNINSVNGDVALLNNLLSNGNPCAENQPLTPIDLSTQKVMHLKPLKLYTAQFVANYNPRLGVNHLISGEGYESVVHSYVFQTSRYRNFAEQVDSYALQRDVNEAITKAAVFTVDCTVELSNAVAQRVLRDQLLPADEILREQYADRFDRLMNGIFALDVKSLQVPITTEFNVVKHNGKVLGILVRNPEPFNNPRIPAADPEISSSEAMETLNVNRHTGGGNWATAEEYYVIHSKDRSQVFVTGRDFNFDLDLTDDLKFTFHYKTYNGLTYDDTTHPVIINFNNYLL